MANRIDPEAEHRRCTHGEPVGDCAMCDIRDRNEGVTSLRARAEAAEARVATARREALEEAAARVGGCPTEMMHREVAEDAVLSLLERPLEFVPRMLAAEARVRALEAQAVHAKVIAKAADGWKAHADSRDKLLALAIEAIDALRELVAIAEGVISNGEKMDSFTLQPARAALAKLEGAGGDHGK